MRDGQEHPPSASSDASTGEGKVLSIVERIEARKLEQIRRSAAAMHLRELESSFQMLDHTKALEDMDVEAMLAELAALSPGEISADQARVARTEIRALRALRSCLRGETEAGLAEWAEVIAEAPKIASPYVLRARWRMGTDPAAALADFDRATEAEPTNPTVYARRGDCHAALGDEDRALANYRRAVALDPSLFDVHHLMAKVFAARGEHAEALAAFDRAIHLAPRYVDFYFGRAKSREGLADWQGAIGDYDRILGLDAARMDAQSARALCLARSGDLGAAVAGMDGLLDNLDDDQPGAEDAYGMLGHIHLLMGQPAPAIELLTHALAIAPDDVPSLARRGEAHWKAGDYPRALADFDRAVALAPDDADCHVGRGKALALLERMPEAVLALTQAIELAPDHAWAHVLRGIYRSHVDEDGAGVKADFTRAVEIEPESFAYRRQRATYLMESLEVREALADVEKLIALRPAVAELYYERGFCKSRLAEDLGEVDVPDHEETEEEMEQRCAAALADLEKAIELGLCNEDLYWEWFRVHEELGNDDPAVLDHAIAKVPDAPMLLYMRRDRRHRRGDDAGAADDHRRLVKLGFQFAGDDWAPAEWV
jgi:tetratricopeptide (TPR) repeat protein